MKMALIFGSLLAVVLLLVSVGLLLHRESPHDRDLRDCQERYGGSRYAEPRDAAYRPRRGLHERPRLLMLIAIARALTFFTQ